MDVAAYDREWYEQELAEKNWWNGWQIVKHPNDIVMYQEIIWQTQPQVIVETGTYAGGSALFLANMMDVMGPLDSPGPSQATVITIDTATPEETPDHPHILYLQGLTSIDLRVLEKVKAEIDGRRAMVILDSDHSEQHVLKELKLYAPLVAKGCYLIVEDTHPLAVYESNPDHGYPADALKRWNPAQHGFETDPRRERFGFTQNPGGYLRKVR